MRAIEKPASNIAYGPWTTPAAPRSEPRGGEVRLALKTAADGSTVLADLYQALPELQAELERMMQRMGLDPEGRKFTPHVTLARLHDASSQDVADYLSVRGYFPSRTFMASRFVLFSSRASTGGGPYVVEDSYALSA